MERLRLEQHNLVRMGAFMEESKSEPDIQFQGLLGKPRIKFLEQFEQAKTLSISLAKAG